MTTITTDELKAKLDAMVALAESKSTTSNSMNKSPTPEFNKSPKEVWRWYAWTRMRKTEPMRWIATCWKGDTKEQAEGKREQALMEDETLILVRETMIFTSFPPPPHQ